MTAESSEDVSTPQVKIPKPKRMTLPSRKTALLIVDMQNDFARYRGKFFVGESVTSIISMIRKVLTKARDAGVHVIYTQDWHRKDDAEFKKWPIHCIEESWGTEIIDELKPLEKESRVRKSTYDPWHETELRDLIRKLDVETLVVVGTVSNIFVLHAISGAVLRGYRCVVPVDCVAALNEFDQKLALRQASFAYQADLTKSDFLDFK